MNTDFVKMLFSTKKYGDMNYPNNMEDFLINNKIENKEIILMSQVHGDKIIVVGDKYERQECDGLITKRKDAALFVLVADCFPILFFDSTKEIIAVVHAGRDGTFKNISGKMIKKFVFEFGSNIDNIFVEIGPGVGACCYEVCSENYMYCNYVRDNFGEEFILGKNIDLLGINKKQLLEIGILEKNITIQNLCTICDDSYFSFRKGSKKERFAGVITFTR